METLDGWVRRKVCYVRLDQLINQMGKGGAMASSHHINGELNSIHIVLICEGERHKYWPENVESIMSLR